MFLCKSNEPSKCNFLIKKLYARSKGIGKRCSQKWDGGCSLPDAKKEITIKTDWIKKNKKLT